MAAVITISTQELIRPAAEGTYISEQSGVATGYAVSLTKREESWLKPEETSLPHNTAHDRLLQSGSSEQLFALRSER